MKRLLALLLCLTCLLGVLASCNDEPPAPPAENPAPSTPSTPSDEGGSNDPGTSTLTGYSVVYPKDASVTVKQAALALATQMKRCFGEDSVAVITDDQATTTKYEVLVGATNRAASAAYYAGEAEAKYAVSKTENSIVVAGFSDVLTEKAARYFATTYLTDANANLDSVTAYTGTLENALTFTPNSGSSAKIVYSTSESYLKNLSRDVADQLKSGIGTSLQRAEAGATFQAASCEIMLGVFDFEEIADVKNALWLDGYAIAVIGNKIVISATAEAEYELAIAAFGEMVAARTLKGTRKVVFAEGDFERALSESVMKDVPNASVKPTAIFAGGDGAYVVSFKDVKSDLFDEYVAALENAGFTKYAMTRFDGAQKSSKNAFATYITEENSVDVAFHTKGWLGYGDSFIGGTMLVTVTPRTGLTLPLQSAPTYTPVDATQYPVILTQLGLGDYHPNEAANCYIIRLADGSFIVHDAAYGGGMSPRTTADEIYEILKKQAPDPNNIVISAWITTHPHSDHMDGLVNFANAYATGKGVTVKQFVHNFADDAIATEMERNRQERVRNAIKKFGAGVEVVKPHTGNVLYYPGVQFNILYTQEDYLSLSDGKLYYGNASTMVMQMVTADGCKVIFGGDSPMMDMGIKDGNVTKPYTYGAIWKWYGSFLQSYVMTNFHHGLGGGSSWDANATIKPKIVLWPATWGKINPNNLTKSSHAVYFTNGLAEGRLHDTPNANGVLGWFVADDNVHVLTFADGKATVAVYDTLSAYKNS